MFFNPHSNLGGSVLLLRGGGTNSVRCDASVLRNHGLPGVLKKCCFFTKTLFITKTLVLI